jgi:hypothetical protein
MSADKARSVPDARTIVRQALESGVIEKELTVADVVDRLGAEVDQVAGYVVAWEKYVLVVGNEELTPEIRFARTRSGGG